MTKLNFGFFLKTSVRLLRTITYWCLLCLSGLISAERCDWNLLIRIKMACMFHSWFLIFITDLHHVTLFNVRALFVTVSSLKLDFILFYFIFKAAACIQNKSYKKLKPPSFALWSPNAPESTYTCTHTPSHAPRLFLFLIYPDSSSADVGFDLAVFLPRR